MNSRRLTLCAVVMALFACAVVIAQDGKPLPKATAEATINGKKVTVTYGRPSINGQALAGKDLFAQAPVGFVWRFGRNEATTIESTGKLEVGGKELAPGKYTLWARRVSDDKWVISFSDKTENNGKPLWGVGNDGQASVKDGFLADLPLTAGKSAEKADNLDIKLAEAKGKGWITIHFGNVTQSGSFGVK